MLHEVLQEKGCNAELYFIVVSKPQGNEVLQEKGCNAELYFIVVTLPRFYAEY